VTFEGYGSTVFGGEGGDEKGFARGGAHAVASW
jgi:hypothetical protein